jgi:hypothetical protein
LRRRPYWLSLLVFFYEAGITATMLFFGVRSFGVDREAAFIGTGICVVLLAFQLVAPAFVILKKRSAIWHIPIIVISLLGTVVACFASIRNFLALFASVGPFMVGMRILVDYTDGTAFSGGQSFPGGFVFHLWFLLACVGAGYAIICAPKASRSMLWLGLACLCGLFAAFLPGFWEMAHPSSWIL